MTSGRHWRRWPRLRRSSSARFSRTLELPWWPSCSTRSSKAWKVEKVEKRNPSRDWRPFPDTQTSYSWCLTLKSQTDLNLTFNSLRTNFSDNFVRLERIKSTFKADLQTKPVSKMVPTFASRTKINSDFAAIRFEDILLRKHKTIVCLKT